MTVSLDLIREVEASAYRCWPAAEVLEYDGWQLRYADGFSRRANSVYPAERSTLDLGLKLEFCRRWYADRGLDLVVRQNPATEPGLDDVLRDHGFSQEGGTFVMVAAVDGDSGIIPIAVEPSEEWWNTMTDLWGWGSEAVDGWEGIIRRIYAPAGFALAYNDDGATVAAGLGVVDDRWLGLFEIIVAEGHRRRGVGADLSRSLLAWGWQLGARNGFLQVVEENSAAISVYESLGFISAYRYWYRRAPSVDTPF